MKQAIIDIGSNSMRLTVYEVAGETFKILLIVWKTDFLESVMRNKERDITNSVPHFRLELYLPSHGIWKF